MVVLRGNRTIDVPVTERVVIDGVPVLVDLSEKQRFIAVCMLPEVVVYVFELTVISM